MFLWIILYCLPTFLLQYDYDLYKNILLQFSSHDHLEDCYKSRQWSMEDCYKNRHWSNPITMNVITKEVGIIYIIQKPTNDHLLTQLLVPSIKTWSSPHQLAWYYDMKTWEEFWTTKVSIFWLTRLRLNNSSFPEKRVLMSSRTFYVTLEKL